MPAPCIVQKRGNDILNDPWYNKDTAFPLTERDRLGLRGLLPPRVMSFEQQYERFSESPAPTLWPSAPLASLVAFRRVANGLRGPGITLLRF